MKILFRNTFFMFSKYNETSLILISKLFKLFSECNLKYNFKYNLKFKIVFNLTNLFSYLYLSRVGL